MPNPNMKCKEKFRKGTMAFKECRIKERQALKKLKQSGKSETKINRAKTSAEKDRILRGKKESQSKRYQENVRATRTKNQEGDARRRGDNVTKTSVTKINKTKNINKNKNTSLTNQQKQAQKQTAMGGAGGSSSSKAKINKKKKNPSNYDMY